MRRFHHLPPVMFLALVACSSPSEPERDEDTRSVTSAVTPTLVEVTGFGSNPGALKMFEYVPAGLAAGAPLVVVLHGCTETAASASVTGWSDLAEQAKFAVVYPEQQTLNNPAKCFNWAGEYGDPANVQRGKGENLSIKQMVDKAIAAHGADPKRVFVVGFSAGGGTAAIMAATYPDVFAGGATLAGIPFDCTTTYAEVNGCMKPGKTKSAADWAALVKAADPGFAGPWPRMSIWQGAADTTVAPANRMELVKQWAGVHGVDPAAPVTDTVDGHSHAVYKDSSGNVAVETYEVAGMAHAVPVVPGAACGTAGAYAVDKGICAAGRIASFFGLTAGGPAGGADAGADAKAPGASSGGVSSSSSTGGVGADGGGTSGGAGAAPGSAAEGSAGSTCTVARPLGSASGPLALLASLLTVTATVLRKRARTSKAAVR
jgi:poly(hydroxyalkanoate) depolymerase family esterase